MTEGADELNSPGFSSETVLRVVMSSYHTSLIIQVIERLYRMDSFRKFDDGW